MLYKILRDNAFFLLPYIVVLLILIPIFIIFSKTEIHLWINQYNSDFSDWFFKHITFLGNGIFIVLLSILLLFGSLRHTVYILTAYVSTGLFTQILKRVFFENVIRPPRYFSNVASLHLVDGVKMLSGQSFPSGHATSSFALFFCLALISTNRYIKLACFIMACLVAFSRVYLSQHFLIDIYAGSIIGTAGAIVFYQVFFQNDRNWHAWTVQKLFKNKDGKA
jgi:membrane-associated phospholipid phosphatase